MTTGVSNLTDTLNQHWKNDKTRFGYKMLLKMGWKEDKGLGKDESGNTSFVKIKKREDGIGLGVEKSTDGAGDHGWNATTQSFNAVLNALKEVYKPDETSSVKKKKDKHKDKKSSNIISVGIK